MPPLQLAVAFDRLRRAARVTAAIDREILRIGDDAQLFRRACGIAIEEGGCAFAWIGLRRGHRVEPVASWGDHADYLSSVDIDLEDPSTNRGPTGRAMRSGQPVVCRDIVADESMAPWRDCALARGFRSSAACPFRSNGAVTAALSIYANVPDWFDAAWSAWAIASPRRRPAPRAWSGGAPSRTRTCW